MIKFVVIFNVFRTAYEVILMKKAYEKPMALVQDLTLNNFVAGACSSSGATPINFSEDTCTYTDESSMFTFFSSQCDKGDGFSGNIVNPNPQSPFAQICYHRPLDEFTFFSS